MLRGCDEGVTRVYLQQRHALDIFFGRLSATCAYVGKARVCGESSGCASDDWIPLHESARNL
jgi:hypothetical protein